MSARRRIVTIVCAASAPLGIIAACTFPEVKFGEPFGSEGGIDSGGEVTEGGFDGGALPDVTERDDASVRTDANACDAADCDCDKDGFLRAGCDAGEDKEDCDDYDPLRHPGAEFVSATPVGHDGDWNCDNEIEKAYKETDCSPCSGYAFAEETPCGTSRNFFQCLPSGLLGLSCDHVLEPLPRAQACK